MAACPPANMSPPLSTALDHLNDAETAILHFLSRLTAAAEDEDVPDTFTLLGALLRSISRAAGAIEAAASDAPPRL